MDLKVNEWKEGLDCRGKKIRSQISKSQLSSLRHIPVVLCRLCSVHHYRRYLYRDDDTHKNILTC